MTGDLIFPTIFGVLMWLAGRVVRSRAELTAELHEAAQVAHEQREADAARAVAEERRRIAREHVEHLADRPARRPHEHVLVRRPPRARAAARAKTGRQRAA